ncbi:MAG: hypothetical protein WC358_06345 [Ignavibacteria bacterium]|jgi:hypothetical protein
MNREEIEFLVELSKNNEKYAEQINAIVEAVKSDIRFKKDESLNYTYDFELPFEIIWRVGYVGEDPDENQYLHVTGLNVPWEVNEMDLECFEFVLLESPQ